MLVDHQFEQVCKFEGLDPDSYLFKTDVPFVHDEFFGLKPLMEIDEELPHFEDIPIVVQMGKYFPEKGHKSKIQEYSEFAARVRGKKKKFGISSISSPDIGSDENQDNQDNPENQDEQQEEIPEDPQHDFSKLENPDDMEVYDKNLKEKIKNSGVKIYPLRPQDDEEEADHAFDFFSRIGLQVDVNYSEMLYYSRRDEVKVIKKIKRRMDFLKGVYKLRAKKKKELTKKLQEEEEEKKKNCLAN